MTNSPTWHDFSLAYAMHQGSKKWHVDLQDFYQRRFNVFCALLELDFNDESLSKSDNKGYWLIFQRAGEAYCKIQSPFSGIFAVPKPAIYLIKKFEPEVQQVMGQHEGICLQVMVEAAEPLWGPCPREVTDSDLAKFNVGKEYEPDMASYF